MKEKLKTAKALAKDALSKKTTWVIIIGTGVAIAGKDLATVHIENLAEFLASLFTPSSEPIPDMTEMLDNE